MYSFTNKNKDLTTLLLANTVALAAFLFYGGSIAQVLWVYWLQSVIIGVVHVVRVIRHKGPIKTSGNARVNDTPFSMHTSGSAGTVIKTGFALFFAMHYGFFHLIYAIFLGVFSINSVPFTINGSPAGELNLAGAGVSFLAVLLNGALFAWHHVLSYMHSESEEQSKPLDFAKPYARIVPMHLIIIFGPLVIHATGSPVYVFALFMLLKTAADIGLFKKKVSHSVKTVKLGF